MNRRRFLPSIAGAAVLALSLAACGGGDGDSEPPAGGDNGGGATQAAEPVTLTMWTRSVTAAQSEALVEQFNKENDQKITIELTVVPFQEYLQKVSAAASGGNLPDILAANVIDGPNYSSLGLWADITDRVQALDFADALAPAHIKAGSQDGKVFAIPHVVDTSALYYNKLLFERAGLDPEAPPTTLQEMHEAAQAISALGDAQGLYFPGDCGGCLAFTVFPSIWAAGGQVMNDDGTESMLDSTEATDVLSVYNEMWNDGSMAPESRNETGATQNAAFESGTVGMALLGSKALGTIPESDVLSIGVAPIPGPDGGRSTFVGGDIIGISAESDHQDAAWSFLQWSLDEQVQLDVYAKAGFIPVRTDLANNEFASADERVLLFNELVEEGQTPYSPRFFQTFNDPQGPFMVLMREAIFGAGPDSVSETNGAVTESLQASI